MAASIPSVVRPTDCCATSCDDTSGSNIPGPAGPAGADGAAGTNGTNAYTTTTAPFTMPAVSANVAVTVAVSSWASVGQVIYISNAGYFSVAAVPDATHITATNLGYTGNVAPTTVVGGSQTVSPAGIKGTDGSAGTTDINDVSPTTTKGDLIVDNGANSPSPSDVRLAAGSDGQLFVSVASQPTGLQWKTVIPNSVVADNSICRFNGTSGLPTRIQDSKVDISDNGAITTTPGGGNARGTDATDLQVTRAAATEVASGTNSVLAGGENNTASGSHSAITGGLSNTASNTNSFVGGGTSNTASGSASTVAGGSTNAASGSDSTASGGLSNTASGNFSTVAGGSGNTASGLDSSVSGGQDNTASAESSTIPGGAAAIADKYGQMAHAAGNFANNGDAQVTQLIWRNDTADATPTELFLDGDTLRATIPANTSWVVRILLVGRSSAGVEAMWSAEGGIHNNAGTTAVTAAFTIASIADGTGATWGVVGNFAVTADDANDSLKLEVTGAGATLIRWVAHARIVEVHY